MEVLDLSGVGCVFDLSGSGCGEFFLARLTLLPDFGWEVRLERLSFDRVVLCFGVVLETCVRWFRF